MTKRKKFNFFFWKGIVVSKFQHGTSLTYKKDYKKKKLQLHPSRSSLPSSPMPSASTLEESKLDMPFSPTRSSKLGIAARANTTCGHHGASMSSRAHQPLHRHEKGRLSWTPPSSILLSDKPTKITTNNIAHNGLKILGTSHRCRSSADRNRSMRSSTI